LALGTWGCKATTHAMTYKDAEKSEATIKRENTTKHHEEKYLQEIFGIIRTLCNFD
jgi:hypothetical protein